MRSKRAKKILVLFSLLCMLSSNSVYGEYQQSSNSVLQNDFADYMTDLREKIQEYWNSPDIVREGHTVVVFKVDRAGNLISSQIKESSGDTVFDEFALNALKKASPFSRFPQNTSKESLTIQYSFDSSVIKTDKLKEYLELSDNFFMADKNKSLEYINKAINEIKDEPVSYFLYARRAKIHKGLGDSISAKKDIEECKRLKEIYDKKRIATCLYNIKKENTPFSYFSLAAAYDSAGDYDSAIKAIDKAIGMTELNHSYKRYKLEILTRSKM